VPAVFTLKKLQFQAEKISLSVPVFQPSTAGSARPYRRFPRLNPEFSALGIGSELLPDGGIRIE
jgi:hypothetical protein